MKINNHLIVMIVWTTVMVMSVVMYFFVSPFNPNGLYYQEGSGKVLGTNMEIFKGTLLLTMFFVGLLGAIYAAVWYAGRAE